MLLAKMLPGATFLLRHLSVLFYAPCFILFSFALPTRDIVLTSTFAICPVSATCFHHV